MGFSIITIFTGANNLGFKLASFASKPITLWRNIPPLVQGNHPLCFFFLSPGGPLDKGPGLQSSSRGNNKHFTCLFFFESYPLVQGTPPFASHFCTALRVYKGICAQGTLLFIPHFFRTGKSLEQGMYPFLFGSSSAPLPAGAEPLSVAELEARIGDLQTRGLTINSRWAYLGTGRISASESEFWSCSEIQKNSYKIYI